MVDETLHQDDTWDGARSEGPGTVVGAYTLVRRLGEGGFGDVWEATQEEPVKRRVALKVLKLGMDTREVVARFELERQALARMEHPHIAHVIDAGATPAGRPYFVMEYVDGVPIDAYCASGKLAVAAILRLLVQVCAAVGHAHTKGIIHRDLKPGNVLVGEHDGGAFAKVIDFGIAKATGDEGRRDAQATQLHQVVGTPRYMSPEQAMGSADIDIRTDIYSLGVILYELLTGSTPVEREKLATASIADTQKLICEIDPPRPSARVLNQATALNAVVTFRPADPRRLARTIRGDLDWIVMKALEKEPARRYQSAAEFADDLRRYLDGEAVSAVPPSPGYRAGKFVRRHKTMVAATALVAVSLVAGIVAFAWQARIAREQARVAQQRADELQQVSDFQAAMFEQLDALKLGRMLGEQVRGQVAQRLQWNSIPSAERETRRAQFAQQWQQVDAAAAATGLVDEAMLDPAVAAIDRQFKRQPLVDAALREAIASAYRRMGRYATAVTLLRQAVAIRQRELGANDSRTLVALSQLGGSLSYTHDFAEAESLLRQALAGLRRQLGPRDPRTLAAVNALAVVLDKQGHLPEAEALARVAVAGRQQALGPNHKDTLQALGNLALVLDDQGKAAEAERTYRQVLALSQRINGPDDRQTIIVANNLGNLLCDHGRRAQGVVFLRQALASARRAWGGDHPRTLQLATNLGEQLRIDGQLDAAEPLLREALDRSRQIVGDDQPATLIALDAYASLLLARSQFAQSEALLAPAEAAARKAFADNESRRLAFYLLHRGQARAALRRYTDAERDLLEAEPTLAEVMGAEDATTRTCRRALADLYAAWDKAEPGHGHAAKAARWRAMRDATGKT